MAAIGVDAGIDDDGGRIQLAGDAKPQTCFRLGRAAVDAGHADMGRVRGKRFLVFSQHARHSAGHVHGNRDRDIGQPEPHDGVEGDGAVSVAARPPERPLHVRLRSENL